MSKRLMIVKGSYTPACPDQAWIFHGWSWVYFIVSWHIDSWFNLGFFLHRFDWEPAEWGSPSKVLGESGGKADAQGPQPSCSFHFNVQALFHNEYSKLLTIAWVMCPHAVPCSSCGLVYPGHRALGPSREMLALMGMQGLPRAPRYNSPIAAWPSAALHQPQGSGF